MILKLSKENCKENVTAQMDPLAEESYIKSIESPKQETLFNTSKINIEVNQTISDPEATGHFPHLGHEQLFILDQMNAHHGHHMDKKYGTLDQQWNTTDFISHSSSRQEKT